MKCKPPRVGDYDRMWKLKEVMDMLSENFKVYYNCSINLSVGEVIVAFKARLIFKQYTPKSANDSESNITKLLIKVRTHTTLYHVWESNQQDLHQLDPVFIALW